MTEKEKEFLRILEKDPRTTPEKLATMTGSSPQAVEKAIKDIARQNEENEAKLVSLLNSSLSAAVKDWIASASLGNDTQLNKFLHRDWEKLSKVTYPVPYDYYLRNYEYSLAKTDCFKTDSIIAPYKAYVEIVETLFIEGYHSSDASDVTRYYYTVTRPVMVNLEYRQDKFIVTNTGYGSTDITRGWNRK